MTPSNEENLARELLQLNLLHNLFKNDVKKSLTLKGGMAMKAVFGVDRSTKDIDLEADDEDQSNSFRARINRAIKETAELGLIENLVVTTPKMTDVTSRWKINGTLAGSQTPIHLTVEVSKRGGFSAVGKREAEIVPSLENAYAFKDKIRVLAFDEQALAFSKIQCLTSEIRTAPRDLYDLHVIIKSKIEPPLELLSNLDADELKRELEILFSKVESMDWNLFRQEVWPKLSEKESSAITEDSYSEMQIEVAETVSKWIETAIEMKKTSSTASKGVGSP